MKHILIYLVFLFLFIGTGCSNKKLTEQLEKEANIKSYYMPNLDVYIVRGSTHGFHVINGEPASTYLQRILTAQSPSVHDGMTQLSIAFYHSRIRIFYIKETGIPASDTEGIYYYLRAQTSFILTDEAGSASYGTVTVDPSPMRLFFMKTVPLEYGVAGVSGIGYKGCTEDPLCRKDIITIIFSGSSGIYYDNPGELRNYLIHEWGHYFGLMHTFEQSSCYMQPQATTNRYMDYFNVPSVFIPCERMIAEQLVQSFIPNETVYNPSLIPNISISPLITYTSRSLTQEQNNASIEVAVDSIFGDHRTFISK